MNKLTNSTLAAVILIIAMGFIVYANSLGGKFLMDDRYLVKDNVYIKSWQGVTKIFTEDIGTGAGERFPFYRPVQMVTYMLDYSVWRLNPTGYHITNMLLHIAAALAVYLFFGAIFKDKTLSFITSLLFLIHPIQTEAVSYISGRSDSLAVLFMILCFMFYVRSRFYVLAIASCVLALLSKEISIVLPALLLLYHYAMKEEIKLKRFLPIAAITFIYVLLRVTVLRFLLSGVSCSTTLLQRIPGFFAAAANYVKLMFWPLGLHMEYGKRVFGFADPTVIAGILIFSALLVYCFKKRKNGGLVFFSIGWFLVSLVPVSNLYPVNAYMAEHWLYLPSIGFFLILAQVLKKHKYVLFALVIAYSVLTINQNSYWRDPKIFYERTLKYAPTSPKALNNLGIICADIGERKKAISFFENTIRLNAADVYAYNNLGNMYRDSGESKKAIELYTNAARVNPDYAGSYYNLGVISRELGKKEEAISFYKKTIEIDPNYAKAYNNLGSLYNSLGKSSEAIVLYKKAIGINPANVEIYNNLANAYGATGRTEEAIIAYKMALKVDPRCAPAHNNLAITYLKKGEYGLAADHAARAVELGYKVHPGLLKSIETKRSP